ncbi:hypothetical protein SAMN05444285_14523 [Draconibacterium orientale]|uniref:Uncharacterized protein n=1 Tax=Draconibacterium orientale TaxID=1168034 RepID=X5DG34_9BACT|nr:hypothetical protein [Draconibacterium orientale]AHW61903.1 hypothetical protein FH5T_10735 [Draconibacterium orientale]SEU10575.1 hypothetical protein SAMN05444285_14523 [Draconibacterium orientale]
MSCKDINRSSVEEGELENGVYTSTYFKMSLNVPESWNVDTLGKIEKEAAAAEPDKKDTVLVANLLTIYREGEKADFKPNLAVIAESCTLYPKLKDESEYLVHVRKQYANLNPITSKIEKPVLTNNIECYTFDLAMTIQDMTMRQTHFATKRDDYYIDITITYQSDTQREELKAIVNSLTLN